MTDCIYLYCREKAIIKTLGVAPHCKLHHHVAVQELAAQYVQDQGRGKSVKARTLDKYFDLLNGPITTEAIADRFKISWPTANKYMREFEAVGRIKPVGNGSYVKV
jgi:Fic family protein